VVSVKPDTSAEPDTFGEPATSAEPKVSHQPDVGAIVEPESSSMWTPKNGGYGKDMSEDDECWLTYQVSACCKKRFACDYRIHKYLVPKICNQTKKDCYIEKIVSPVHENREVSVCELNSKPWNLEAEKMSPVVYKAMCNCDHGEQNPTCFVKKVVYEAMI
jgi:hypothetical protein